MGGIKGGGGDMGDGGGGRGGLSQHEFWKTTEKFDRNPVRILQTVSSKTAGVYQAGL